MGIEIERKFLVKDNRWKKLTHGDYFSQGYLVDQKDTTVRVRIARGKGFLTIKGAVTDLSRPEFEYEIPLAEAQEMLNLWCGNQVIEKNRYCIAMEAFTWEVDEFLGENDGLILAEIELASPDQAFPKPDWIGEEVSGDVRYYNSYLVKHPYQSWNTP